MLGAPYAEILQREGFQLIGKLAYRVGLSVWWNPAPDKLLQVIVLNVGASTLLKADKTYYVKSVSAEGETWARDIGLLHDYLEGHFPELRISFSHFRDVPPELAEIEVRRRMAVEAPTKPQFTVEQIAGLQRELQTKEQDLSSMDDLLGLSAMPSDILTDYVRQQRT